MEKKNEWMIPKEIAEKLECQKGSVNKSLLLLYKEGLVERKRVRKVANRWSNKNKGRFFWRYKNT